MSAGWAWIAVLVASIVMVGMTLAENGAWKRGDRKAAERWRWWSLVGCVLILSVCVTAVGQAVTR